MRNAGTSLKMLKAATPSAKGGKDETTVRHNDATARILAQLPGSKAAESGAAGGGERRKAVGAASSSGAAGGGGGGGAAAKKPMAPPAPKPAPRWLQTTGKHSAGFTSTTLDPVTVISVCTRPDVGSDVRPDIAVKSDPAGRPAGRPDSRPAWDNLEASLGHPGASRRHLGIS